MLKMMNSSGKLSLWVEALQKQAADIGLDRGSGGFGGVGRDNPGVVMD